MGPKFVYSAGARIVLALLFSQSPLLGDERHTDGRYPPSAYPPAMQPNLIAPRAITPELSPPDFCHVTPTPLTNPELKRLSQLIHTSFSTQALQTGGNLGVQEIRSLFLSLDRSKVPPEEYIRVKYMMLHWDLTTKKRIWKKLKRATPDQKAVALAQALSDLQALGMALNPAEIQRLETEFRALNLTNNAELAGHLKYGMALVLSNFGFRDIRRSRAMLQELGATAQIDRLGPATHTSIAGIDKTPVQFSEWSKKPEFSRYEYERDAQGKVVGIRYHGMSLRVGDALNVNNHTDSGWVFTGFSNPKSIVGHTGTFTLLTAADGRLVPAVVEQATTGARAVPVNDFFTEHTLKNNYYIEINRPKQLPNPDGLNQAAQAALGKGKYDFNADYAVRNTGSCPAGNTCSGLAAQLLKAGGSPLPHHYSTIHPTAQANLRLLGHPLKSYYTPSDVIRSPQYTTVGVVDLGEFTRLVSTEAAMKEFSCLMTTTKMNTRKLKPKTNLTARVLRNAQRGRRLAGRILESQGIPRENTPMGSPKAAAASIEVGSWVAKANERLGGNGALNITGELIASTNEENPRVFDLYEFLARPDVQRKASGASPELHRLFQ